MRLATSLRGECYRAQVKLSVCTAIHWLRGALQQVFALHWISPGDHLTGIKPDPC